MWKVACATYYYYSILISVTIFGGNVMKNQVLYGDVETCHPDKLTVYKMILHTFWSRNNFPKHYPDWKPTAQWSKIYGKSHDKSYTLFRLGQKSSLGVKTFAETGSSDVLEQQNQNENGIYDEFNAPSIPQGVGRSETKFFVDGNHSKVSLISRIIPSPDWFIGLDSFDLCVKGNWLDTITIEVDPIDAGTDNGFTFTAPNWTTEPQGVAYKITAHYPAHPAGSFFYPYLKKLPPIATFQFIKIREYELSEIFHYTEDERRYNVLKTEEISNNNINILNGNEDVQATIDEETEEENRRRSQQFFPLNSTKLMNDRAQNNILFNHHEVTPVSSLRPAVFPKGDKNAIINGIADSYLKSSLNKPQKKYKKPRKHIRKYRPPRDCRVGEWSSWSSCSKSCGIGEMTRRRDVIKHSKRGGRLCPPLIETKWCGSALSCKNDKQYFNNW